MKAKLGGRDSRRGFTFVTTGVLVVLFVLFYCLGSRDAGVTLPMQCIGDNGINTLIKDVLHSLFARVARIGCE